MKWRGERRADYKQARAGNSQMGKRIFPEKKG
jgi:hypothetical protein